MNYFLKFDILIDNNLSFIFNIDLLQILSNLYLLYLYEEL